MLVVACDTALSEKHAPLAAFEGMSVEALFEVLGDASLERYHHILMEGEEEEAGDEYWEGEFGDEYHSTGTS